LLASGYAYPRAPLLTRSLQIIYEWFGVSEFSSRLPSAILGILTIPLVYLVSRRWFGARTALIAAIFVACDPFEIGWSRACRMYSMFQFFFLAAMFFFWSGFGAEREGEIQTENKLSGKILSNLNVPLLLISATLLYASYTTHQNTAFFVVSLGVFILAMFVREAFTKDCSTALRGRYGIFGMLIVAVALVIWLAPPVRTFFEYAIGYQPKWAETASAQNQWRIVEFLFDMQRFPIYAFFLCGVAIVLKRWHKAGIFSLVSIVAPILMFTFVFQYRKNDYIYNVYPFYLILAAYGIDQILTLLREKVPFGAKLTKHRDALLLMMAVVWLPLTPSFRFAQKIPRLEDGNFNGAIYHNEWQEAAAFLKNKLNAADALISTLPLSTLYYVGRVEYNLNDSNADLARQNGIVDSAGASIDFYSGADIIDNLDTLRKTLQQRPQGWLLVDNYRFNNPVYVSKEIHDHIIAIMVGAFESANKTVTVYRWNLTGDNSAPSVQ